ncbi:MAG: hypothetical protein NTU64_14705 [Hyphomicrobiales bacterium]|nr:hypothetical protein [Hyphomicrobiales bacterium]
MSAEITLIKKHGTNPVMSKRIFLDEQGAVRSDGSQCLMIQGTATRAAAETAGTLAEHIMACGSDQAIALGSLEAELPDLVTITVPRKMKDSPGAITRSRKFISYRPGTSGWALIDFDTKGMPGNVAASIEAAGSMWGALLRIAPGLQRAARVSRASTSAALFRSDTGAQLPGSGGSHHYLLVKDAGDIERFLRDLHNQCWLHGLGWHMIGGAGQLLDRSLVDRMVGYGERLCFEGAPLIDPPLAQDPTGRIAEAFGSEEIDTRLIVPALTEYEQQRVNEAKEASAAALGKAAAEIRSQHDRVLAEKITAKLGMPLATALRLVMARHRGVLLPYLELDFDDLGMVPVATVLADPNRYIGETLADPLEGAEYGRNKAKVMKADDGGLFIHSFAHGRGIYHLRHDGRSAKAAIAKAPADGLVDYAMAIMAATDMEPDELADFAAAVAKAANIGVRAVMARIAKERQKREQAERKAAVASGSDGRIIRPRPETDGELMPTVTFLDQLLASDQREEPPMRDASGNLVEVRVREPWSLHLLTADGTNNAADDANAMKAPAEPGLVQLTPSCIELLIERHVRWSVQKKNISYFGALPRAYIDALMQYPPSTIPVARAINTTPLVTMSGNIIDGVGLDRDTGLIHRIDPALRACLPTKPPTEKFVQDALTFLFDEWLVDVALDRVGKSIAIMLALTLIERVLLPERPAFFVTAGQRGGGKTTLVNMITLAVLGRRAAAAGWSGNAEERKKALFSYLRQGVASLAWDNIARGSAISCPHIEAALTASEISDRVLGVSRVETVPSATVQIFTGNSITPRGDMASRSLMMALNVDRPDPENRTFEHNDPLAWTLAHRPKILRALYGLLIAGALNRTELQTAKTRFKTWWSVVGWPMEYAADLLGTTVNCTELMRIGEAGDEEASAASAALTMLHGIWGGDVFTSGAVVKAMTPEPKQEAFYQKVDDASKARADAIADALGELVGKRLDFPTAHSIGKLFQKRLVGRPTWINDGQTVATLVKTSGHNENTYRVSVAASGQSQNPPTANTFSPADTGQKHSRHSPHSPKSSPHDGNVGNVGNLSVVTAQEETLSPDDDRGTLGWSTRL